MATIIEATDSTPKILLDFSSHLIAIVGESYPEDVNAFYGEIMKNVNDYLASTSGANIVVDINLKYFNSSSTKVFYNFFQALEAATEGNSVTINWRHAEEDDMSLETGEGFAEDLEHVTFNFLAYK